MKHIYFKRMFVCVVILYAFVLKSFGQSSAEIWNEIDAKQVTIGDRSSVPTIFKAYRLNFPAMVSLLNTAVYDTIPGAYLNGPVISIPMPDGSLSRFRAAYTPVMHPELAAKFPNMKTFTAIGIDDTLAIARLDYTQWGFHALIISPNGWVIVDPASLGNTSDYITFNRSSNVLTHPFICQTAGSLKQAPVHVDNNLYRSSGTSLRTYRLALACTGEYAAFFGGTVSGAAAGMLTSVNRVTQVYEVELSIRLTLVANNNVLIYTNASTDPYTNTNGSNMLTQNQTTVDASIGSANYDIGHVFSTGGGGVAFLGCVCGGSKAGGVTGSSAPTGDGYDIDYVAHEMGHQFGGNHTFNSVTGSCGGGNRSSGAAYEPGSGTTIMAYAGICGADDIQPHSDAIFHTKSYDEIQIYTTTGNGSTCDVPTATGNTAPVVTLPANKTIPKLTSFILTGSATDANGDPLTYLWEQYDLGPSGAPNSPTGNAPLFRDFTPTTSPSRTFPKIQDIVRNTQVKGEILPSYARSMTFRFTARDNKLNGGGVMHDDNVVTVTVVDPSDTFKVTSPNTNVTWNSGSVNTVTWKVASTTAAPVSCALVNILLSIDSGYTFPYTLATNTANDGTESITLPVVTSTKARIKVESVGNIFFDMSNVNFTIAAGSAFTTITTGAIAASTYCAGASVSVPFTTNGAANAGNIFTAQLSNSAGSFASPVSIGTLTSTAAGTISATIPANTTTGSGYRIRVVSSAPVVTGTDNGTNITINSSVAASVAISTPLITICSGTNVTFTATPTNGGATPSYQWKIGTTNVGTNSPTYATTTLANGNVVTCVMTSNASCVTGNPATSNAITMTVNPNVTASVSIAANTGITICTGTNVTFTATPANGGATPSYQWKLNNVNVGTNSTTYSNASLVNGDFLTCVMTSNASCMTGSPATSNTLTMTVNPNVTASVAIAANPGITICSGTNVTFTATPVNGGTTPSYQWKLNNVNVGTNSATYSNASLVNGNFLTCVMTSNASCVTGSQATSNTLTMTVNPNVAASVSISANPGTTICSGTNVIFTATPANGGSTPSYQWKLNNVNVGTNSPTYSNASLANGNFLSCMMTSNATCATGNPATSPNLTMTVISQVSASVNISASPSSTICSGTNVTFTAAIANGGAAPSYQWKIGSTNVGTNSSTFSSSSLANGNIITCVLTSSAVCVSNNPVTSSGITMSVTPTVAASISISANPGINVCAGTNVTFTANLLNGGGAPAYQWKIGGINAGTNSQTFSSSSLTNGNVITCEFSSHDACIINNPSTSNALTMTVTPNVTPLVSISAAPGNAICSGELITFTATATNGGATPVYQWKNNGAGVGTNSNSFSSTTLANGDLITCEMTSNANCVVGNPAVSNMISIAVNPSLSVNSFSPPGGNAGTVVTISGNGFLTATNVKFNSISASFLIVANNTITATVPSGITTGPITINGCGQGSSATDFIHVEQVTVHLKVMIEGLQSPGGLMNAVLSPSLSDSVQLSLANATAPFGIISSVKNVLNLSGEGDFIFPPSVFGNSYYLVVDHRNCLQTWSSAPVIFTDSTLTYDFSNASSKAYGNNLMNIAGIFAIRSGDVNKDGVVDFNDVTSISQSAIQFDSGYIPQDLNGDSMIEAADYSLVENNLLMTVARP